MKRLPYYRKIEAKTAATTSHGTIASTIVGFLLWIITTNDQKNAKETSNDVLIMISGNGHTVLFF
jgi:hypothetical protein